MKGRAVVAAILAIGVTTVLVLISIAIVSGVSAGRQLSPEGGSLVAGVVGTVVGALAVYLGESAPDPRPVEQVVDGPSEGPDEVVDV